MSLEILDCLASVVSAVGRKEGLDDLSLPSLPPSVSGRLAACGACSSLLAAPLPCLFGVAAGGCAWRLPSGFFFRLLKF